MSPAAPVLQSEKITPGDEIDIREIDEYVYKGRWWKNKSLFRLNSLLLLVLIASAGNGYDGSMMNGLQTLEIWREEFGTPTGSILGLFNAAQNLGGIASLPLQAYLTDTYGRRKAICFGCAVMLAGTAMQTASSTVGVFIGARVLIGFGNGFSGNAAPCLISELAYPTQRASVVALYNTLWYSGSIIAALTTLGTFSIRNSWAWRIPSLLQGFQPIIQVTLIWLVAESPRWLVSKGREEEARAVLAKYHTEDNNPEHPLVEFEMKEISAGIEMDRMANATTWKTLFATTGNRRRMRIIIAVAFFSQWSGNGIASYYLNIVLRSIGITSELIQNVFNVSLQIFNLITAMTAAILVERLGRRFLFITSACGMCVAMVAWTLCAYGYNIRGSQAAGNCIMFLIFVFYAAYNLAMCPLVVAYPCEILPFSIRAKGLVVNTTIITTALVFNQYVNPIALEAIGWYYYIVYCVWLAFEAVFLWRYVVETKGLTLEETSRVFDGEAKVREAAVLDDLSTRRGSDQESPSLEVDEKQKTLSGYTSHIERV